MANMSYCRFENTANDLQDCVDNWENNLSNEEAKARQRVIDMAFEILEMEGYDLSDINDNN